MNARLFRGFLYNSCRSFWCSGGATYNDTRNETFRLSPSLYVADTPLCNDQKCSIHSGATSNQPRRHLDIFSRRSRKVSPRRRGAEGREPDPPTDNSSLHWKIIITGCYLRRPASHGLGIKYCFSLCLKLI